MAATVQVFAANNSSYRSRKRAHRACDQCKRRRKKCLPPYEGHERCAGCTRDGLCCSLVAIEPPPPATKARTEPVGDDAQSLPPGLDPGNAQSRFIGDLNPESVFLTATENPPPGGQPSPSTSRNEVGVWVSPAPSWQPRKRRKISPEDSTQAQACMPASGSELATPSALYTDLLSSLNAFSLPPRPVVDALLALYSSSIHPLYPLVDDSTAALFRTPDAIPLLLLQAILLVSSRHPSAANHLILSSIATATSSSAILPSREFAELLYTRITALLHAGVEKDRKTLIRVYGLLSLHSPDGPHGNEAASMNLCAAIHHAHSIGLHVQRGGAGGKGEARLWWCLWGLDRLHAAINGRPVVARGEDASIDFPEDAEGVFKGMLRLAGLLEKVIALYRPQKVSGPGQDGGESCWEDGFPGFEDLVGGGAGIDEAQFAALQLLYHSIAILSHRSHSLHPPPLSAPKTKSHLRRIASATSIHALATTASSHNLPPTQLTPYAVSLALSTFYALVRDGKSEYDKPYKECVGVLEGLGRWWWFADAMARLGRDTLGRRRGGSGKGAGAAEMVGCSDGGGGALSLPEETTPESGAQVVTNPPPGLLPQDSASANATVEFDADLGLDLDLDPGLDEFLLDLWPDPSNPVDFFGPMFGEGSFV